MADGSTSSTARQGLASRLLADKRTSALFFLRILMLWNSAVYSLPFIGSTAAYYQSLMAYVGVSALRATQRLPRFQLSRAYLQQILLEDSVHYLLYSVNFLNSFPFSLMLVSISLFSVMHVVNFLKSIHEHLPTSLSDHVNKLSRLLDENSVQLYRVIAFSEVIAFPVVVIAVFVGVGPLLVPLMHYQFLVLRYMSRRFPYTRYMFTEMRSSIEQIAARPACPSIVRQLLTGFVKLVSRMAPAGEYSMPERP